MTVVQRNVKAMAVQMTLNANMNCAKQVASAGAIISFLFRQGPSQRSSRSGQSLMIFSVESFVMYVSTRIETFSQHEQSISETVLKEVF